jgi:predicted aconitase with swiveling domain
MDVVLFIHGRNGALTQAILVQGLSLVILVACIVHFVPQIPFVASERVGNL